MNELIFLLHTLIIIAGTFGSLKFGREGLIAWTSLLGVTANLLILKQISLLSLTVTCCDVYIVGTLLGLNLLQEFYGKKYVQTAIWINFLALLCFALFSQLHLFYIPYTGDTAHASYKAILEQGPRIFLASIIAYFVTLQCDSYLFGKIRSLHPNTPLYQRNFISLSISQAIDTILFGFLGLYGQVDSIWHIICFSYVIKLTVILTTIPCTKLTKKWITP